MLIVTVTVKEMHQGAKEEEHIREGSV